MRAVVGHLTRNVKIIGTTEGGYGAHIQIYHWQFKDSENEDVSIRGSAYFDGVEFVNCGQRDSPNAAIHILNTNSEGLATVLMNSAMHSS
jgi:hypothetical protein